MKLNYLLFCDRADRTDEQKVILHGIIDGVLLDQEPSESSPKTLGSIGIGYEVLDPALKEVSDVGLKITDPNGKELFQAPSQVKKMADDGTPIEKITGIGNLPLTLTQLGIYKLSLSIDGVIVGETELSVSLRKK